MRAARREAGLTQSELSREIGCKQSALSVFEQGDGTKLNDEAIAKLSKKFGLKVVTEGASDEKGGRPYPVPGATPASGYCPNPHCPSNARYAVDGVAFYRPDRAVADPIGGTYCAVCGELLERQCPNCGAPVHAGAVCSVCGLPYIAG